MTAPEPWWLWLSLCGVAVIVGLPLIGWALFWDRARGRRRCGACWYHMAGVPGLQCPECGRTAKAERHLLRTRRRYGWALLGLLACLGLLAPTVVGAIREERYWEWMPKSLLIHALPWACERTRYWTELEKRVVEREFDREGFKMSVKYRARSLTSGQLGLLGDRIAVALESPRSGSVRTTLLEVAHQLGALSPRIDGVVADALNDPDWDIRRLALAISRQRHVPLETVLPAVIVMVNEPLPDGGLWGPQEDCLAEAAGYLESIGGSNPQVVPTLIKLLGKPFHPKIGFRLRDAVLRAFASIGPAAADALPLLRIDEDYQPWHGIDPVALFAYWMVEGRFGDRCATLAEMAGAKDWHYRDFAVEELGKGEPCRDAIGVLQQALQDEVHWVRIDAAMSLIRLGSASSDSYALLQEVAADNFDAFWQVTRFAIEQGLDPAPLEAMIQIYRSPGSRVPSVNVDNVERELRDYRQKRPAGQPFEPW